MELLKIKNKIRKILYKYHIVQKPESIYFYTFHKCASTLFSSYVLKNITGLDHVDYAKYLWDKPDSYNKTLKFNKKGHVYGPIRLSTKGELVKRLLVSPTSNSDFIKDKTAIFFVRDPRDILVSQYYSFGFTHVLNPVEDRREKQLKKREKTQSLTLDEYVIENVNDQVENFLGLFELSNLAKRSVILKYEDMVEKYDDFIKDLLKIVDLDQKVIENTYQKSRPKKNIDNTSHQRSGRVKHFENELKPETINVLNNKLKEVLIKFDY